MKYFALNTFAAVIAFSSFTAEASKIYTCEINGTVVYTSRPSGGCHAPDLPPIGRYSSARYDAPEMMAAPEPQRKAANNTKRSPSKTVNAKAKAPAAPKPAASNSRRTILEIELSNERRALSEAQKSLAQARAVKGGTIDRQQIKNLEGAVLDRQQNIQALQRELGRM